MSKFKFQISRWYIQIYFSSSYFILYIQNFKKRNPTTLLHLVVCRFILLYYYNFFWFLFFKTQVRFKEIFVHLLFFLHSVLVVVVINNFVVAQNSRKKKINTNFTFVLVVKHEVIILLPSCI